jgi:hypothetical protein
VLDVEDNNYAHYYQNDPKLRMITWTDGYSPHPYFGYESSTTRASEKILSEAGDDDFTIGISGGPVAGSLAEYLIRNPSHFEPLREAIPPFGEKNLQIVNLANGGYKQAQQFFVAVFHALVSHPISTILWRAQTRGDFIPQSGVQRGGSTRI